MNPKRIATFYWPNYSEICCILMTSFHTIALRTKILICMLIYIHTLTGLLLKLSFLSSYEMIVLGERKTICYFCNNDSNLTTSVFAREVLT